MSDYGLRLGGIQESSVGYYKKSSTLFLHSSPTVPKVLLARLVFKPTSAPARTGLTLGFAS